MDSTLVKGLALLQALANHGNGRGVTDLAAEVGFGKSRVHGLLQTLIERGFVLKEESSGHYRCTLKIWELGSRVLERLDIRPAARPMVEALAARTGETVHLSILDGAEILHIDKIDSAQPVRAYSRIGGRAPAFCVATGKAQLAYAPESILREVAKGMKRYTSRTITNFEDFRKELQRVRETGYAINRGEWREGVVGLAAPILDMRNGALAAIGISGPVERLSLTHLRGFAPLVVKSARSVARTLGQ